MIRSMTAFTRQERTDHWGHLVWELRSVNHRFLDVSVRTPEEFRTLEGTARERVAHFLRRGKVDCQLRYEAPRGAGARLSVDVGLARQLVAEMERVADLLAEPGPVDAWQILTYPGVLQTTSMELEAVQDASMDLLEVALVDLTSVRQREGARIRDMLRARCDALQAQVEEVRKRMPEVLLRQRERLQNRLEELTAQLDEGRLEQEMVLLAQKLDVDEEMERLGAHLTEVRQVLDRDEAVGRRLDFLAQEMHREANTLGAKSIDLIATRAALEMKVLIEQMREQVQNVE